MSTKNHAANSRTISGCLSAMRNKHYYRTNRYINELSKLTLRQAQLCARGTNEYLLQSVRPFMGSVGDAYDNAMAESFFASLECELIDRRSWKNKTETRLAIFTWIES
ncbi:MAG: hypothetical protein KIT26_12185 [Nitrosomonas sp.]|nr:hypothetical protein [Nitrosomonas sp.]